MAVFFLFVGLEIKRELLRGELSSPRKAALPLAGAMGGMIVPTSIYLFFNHATPWISGWGIPMATDIAFALLVLNLLGKRVPASLKIYLTALAIIDDLGAVLVIACFYTAGIIWSSLGAGLGVLLSLAVLNRVGVSRPGIYLGFGVLLWMLFLKSGIHATVAGILLAWVIPSKTGAKLENSLQPFVSYGILPLFALANAGVSLSAGSLFHPISLGVFLGLMLGKQIGITAFSWLAVRFEIASLPPAVGWAHIYGIGWLGGIGFTMSLFIAKLAFSHDDAIGIAKLGVLAASVISGIVGALILMRSRPKLKTGNIRLSGTL